MERAKTVSSVVENIATASLTSTGILAPLSAILGNFVGYNIGLIIGTYADVAKRNLSKLEERRLNKTMEIFAKKYNENMNKGERLRDDEFFKFNGDYEKTSGAEVFENFFNKVRNECEESKIKYMVNLMEYISFHNDISIEDANKLINIAEQLSFRQLRLLSMFMRKIICRAEICDENEMIYQDIYALYNLGMVHAADEEGVGKLRSYRNIYSCVIENYSIGKKLAIYMKLNDLNYNDVYESINGGNGNLF